MHALESDRHLPHGPQEVIVPVEIVEGRAARLQAGDVQGNGQLRIVFGDGIWVELNRASMRPSCGASYGTRWCYDARRVVTAGVGR